MRAALTAVDGRWQVRSRTGRDVSRAFPELSVLPDLLGGRRVALDGELVVLDRAGVSDFSRLQQRIGVSNPSARLLREVPVMLYVFDLLVLDEQVVLAAPYTERRQMLEQLRLRGGCVDTPPYFVDAGAELYAAAQEHSLEGIVCKRLTSPYTPGHRSKTWIKTVSVRQTTVFVSESGSSPWRCSRPAVRDMCRCGFGIPAGRVVDRASSSLKALRIRKLVEVRDNVIATAAR